jgi:hypothetical protein
MTNMIKLTDASDQPHYYALDGNGRPMPMEPAQYEQFCKLGGPAAVYQQQMENSPFRTDYGRPDTFAHIVQTDAVKSAMDKDAALHDPNIDPGPDAELHRELDRAMALADTPPPMTDQERAALAPKTWEEYWERAATMQKGWSYLGYDLVQINQETLRNADGRGTEPLLEVRLSGTSYALYSGPLVVLEKRLQIDLSARARRDEANRLAEEYRENRRREAAEAIANSPAAKLAAAEAKQAATDAELAELRYQMRQLNARL